MWQWFAKVEEAQVRAATKNFSRMYQKTAKNSAKVENICMLVTMAEIKYIVLNSLQKAHDPRELIQIAFTFLMDRKFSC